MKKLFATTLTTLICGSAYTLPVGNPADASLLCDGLIWEGHCASFSDPCLCWRDALSFRFGFYGDYVFNRNLEVDTASNRADIEHTRINTNAGYLAANLWDRLDVFATLGATNFHLESNASSFQNFASGARIELETVDAFSWSVGARGTIWECGCTSLGLEGQYFTTRPKLRRVTVAAQSSEYPHKLNMRFYEWQVGVGIAHRINIFVPYIAIKWSHAQLSFHKTTVMNRIFGIANLSPVVLDSMQSGKNWGYAVGVTLVDCEKVSLTVEGRFSDETAVHVNGQIRF